MTSAFTNVSHDERSRKRDAELVRRARRVYARLTPVYDIVFGAALQAGRVAAMERMNIAPGHRVLEVGIGTGLTVSLYPRDCDVTGIDLSAEMLEKARERVRHERLRNVTLMQMDAASLRFRDESFDLVYAPYTMSVVPDPVKVAREMRRVCKVGGSIVFLNHFRSINPVLSVIERTISPITARVGFSADLDLKGLLQGAELTPASVEKVNWPPLWTLVRCTRT